jgi:hypothetical protein
MSLRLGNLSFLAAFAITSALATSQTAITTYHVDNNRTGWNSHESVLTPTNVASASFGLLKTVALDAQVDSQPLFVPGVNITAGTHQGLHDVVYVVTEGDTIYAIDGSGTVLLSPNFGTANGAPAVCNSKRLKFGILSTP